MGQIGFGSYRISIKSKEHEAALVHALQNGLKLIDTSANYTNGDSELLIGKVLEENPKYRPIIVTKAGYIQGNNLLNIPTKEDLVEISEGLKHSIHPIFLEQQITLSLQRLKINSIDVFLLHNPEYFFEIQGNSRFEFYQRIEKAFIHLEEEVKRGRIRSYGISSNNFILPHQHPAFVDLESIIQIAQTINKKHHFTHVQFPMNLIEIGALEKFGEFGNLSLVEIAKMNNLITMINRPLNAFKDNQLIRLATYKKEIRELNKDADKKLFEDTLNLLKNKWVEEHKNSGEDEITELTEVTLIKQWTEIWDKLPSPDAVDQVYHAHLFPFIAQVWGGSLTKEESEPFYRIYELSIQYSRKEMDMKASKFRDQALEVGLLNPIDDSQFAKEVIETYLSYGIDYVLVGMRKVDYVDQLKSLF